LFIKLSALSALIGLIISVSPVGVSQRSHYILEEQPEVEVKKVLSVPEMILYYSDLYGIDGKAPLEIAKAESQYKNVCNKQYGCGAGIGIFQIVQTTFDENCEGSPYDIKDNIVCGIKMIKNGDYWRWSQSKHVWIHNIPEEIKNKIKILKR